MNVAEVIGILDGAQADGVGGADDLAALDAAAGQPHRKAEVVVIAALAALRLRRAAELAAPQNQRRIEQAAPLQVRQQAGDRLIDSAPPSCGDCSSMSRVRVPLLRAAAGDHDAGNARPSRPGAAPADSAGRNCRSARRRRRRESSVSRVSPDRSKTCGASVCIRKARSYEPMRAASSSSSGWPSGLVQLSG